MQPLTRPAISASVSGVSTTNGYSTRQSVASVTCETRDRPSNLMLSLAVRRRKARWVWRRRSAISRKLASKAATARAAAWSSSPTRASRSGSASGVRRLPHLGQAVVQGFHQQAAALGVVQQVVLQVGIALHHPDVAQHLVEHAGRAAGAALLAQPVQHLPGTRAQQPDHDFAVGERGVVVGDLAQARRIAIDGGDKLGDGVGCVHLWSVPARPSVAALVCSAKRMQRG